MFKQIIFLDYNCFCHECFMTNNIILYIKISNINIYKHIYNYILCTTCTYNNNIIIAKILNFLS